jgi:hypothetical protein
MIMCITAPADDLVAIEMAERFERGGFCPVSTGARTWVS